jgi:hypothetical protein
MLAPAEPTRRPLKNDGHTYLHRKNKSTLYLPYPPHLLLKYKKENPEQKNFPEPTDLIYIGFTRKR